MQYAARIQHIPLEVTVTDCANGETKEVRLKIGHVVTGPCVYITPKPGESETALIFDAIKRILK